MMSSDRLHNKERLCGSCNTAQIIFTNMDPTGDKTNLISIKVHQLDSFWLTLCSLRLCSLSRTTKKKKTINPHIPLKKSIAFYFLLAGFHRCGVSFVSKQPDKSGELSQIDVDLREVY